MDETYNLTAIILNRQDWRERDSRITVYSKEKGKQVFVVRGTKKITSKLVGHIEPISLVELMAIRGRKQEYVGGVAVKKNYKNIKADLEKINIAGKGIKIFNNIVKPNEEDDSLFILLKNYLDYLDEISKSNTGSSVLPFVYHSYLLKLYSLLGYMPVLDRCVACGKVAIGSSFLFSYKKGGIICSPCAHNEASVLPLSGEIRNLLLLISADKSFKFITPTLSKVQLNEFLKVIDFFCKYHKPA